MRAIETAHKRALRASAVALLVGSSLVITACGDSAPEPDQRALGAEEPASPGPEMPAVAEPAVPPQAEPPATAAPEVAVAPAEPASAARAAPLPPVAAQPRARTHRVQRGETLMSIAAQHYAGDRSQYRRIFEANRDVLADPHSIRVGQTLRLP